ncbi:SCO-spondin-like [Gigantopelta aegis]|uniref:SCO-spondin-like n=1 Tax=Gigantopelta aegis TaxID=1735272 RepID=UPI001B88758A|nr:SCO-spondin-like [Gigantopelta aegis]
MQSTCVNTQCTDGEDEKCVCAENKLRDESGDCVPKENCDCYDTNGMVIKKEDLGLRNDTCIECKCVNHIYQCSQQVGCCKYSTWSQWSKCDAKCNEKATKERSRTVLDGQMCNETFEVTVCSGRCQCEYNGTLYNDGQAISTGEECKECSCVKGNVECKTTPVDGGIGQWTPWNLAACQNDHNCKDYEQTRTRECNKPRPECNGKNCTENMLEKKPCSDTPCCEPMFTKWSECPRPCHDESKNETPFQKTRVKYYPDGAACGNNNTETDDCTEPCDCVKRFEWSDWGTCDKQCGVVNVTRSRGTASDASCQYLPSEETKQCFSHECNCTEPDTVYTNTTGCERTCAEQIPSVTCGQYLNSGCICVGDLVRKDGVCVTSDECETCKINGKTYENGEEIPSDNRCETCKCKEGFAKCDSNCEDVKTCSFGEESYNDGCCWKCRPVGSTCQKMQRNETIPIDKCRKEYATTVDYCGGGCGNAETVMDPLTGQVTSTCKCCFPTKHSTKQVNVTCDNNETKQISMMIIETCECNMCATEKV